MDVPDDIVCFRGSGISRRHFIKYLGSIGLLMSGSMNAPIAAASKTFVFNVKNDFSFVEQVGLGPQIDAPIVEEYLHPLHREQIKGSINNSVNLLDAKSQLKDFYNSEAIQWQENFQLAISLQHYGVAYENSEEAKKLVVYSKCVSDYMANRIQGLCHVGLSWNVLHTSSPDLTSVDGFNLVIGRFTYLVSRIFVENVDIEDSPYLSGAVPLDRAINYIESGQSAEPKRALIYLIPGATSLVSPFSEILHISLHKPSKLYEQALRLEFSREQSQKKAVETGETVNEALALLLAMEFQENYGRVELKKHINFMATSLKREYPLLPSVMSYAQKHGLQATIDRYLENPAKLMASV